MLRDLAPVLQLPIASKVFCEGKGKLFLPQRPVSIQINISYLGYLS